MQEQMRGAGGAGNETVEASAGGGMVTVKANGARRGARRSRSRPEAIDPRRPRDARRHRASPPSNEALRSARSRRGEGAGLQAELLGGLGFPASASSAAAPSGEVEGPAQTTMPVRPEDERPQPSSQRTTPHGRPVPGRGGCPQWTATVAMLSPAVDNLVAQLTRLPGIGSAPRSGSRSTSSACRRTRRSRSPPRSSR